MSNLVTKETIEAITRTLPVFCKANGSMNKAAQILGISSAIVSYMSNDKWDRVSVDMAETIANRLSLWESVKDLEDKSLRPFKAILLFEHPIEMKRQLLDHLIKPETASDLKPILRLFFESIDEVQHSI